MICAVGFSAGGHLCGCLANLFDDPVLRGIFGKRADLIRPDAVILSYPVITSGQKSYAGSFDALCGDDQNLKRYLSLEHRVKGDSSPAFIGIPIRTKLCPYITVLFTRWLAKNNVPFELHVFEKGDHGLATAQLDTNAPKTIAQASAKADQWLDLSINWLKDRNIKLKSK